MVRNIIIIYLVLSSSVAFALSLPDWVEKPPKGYFSGISEPSKSVSRARDSAKTDVMKSILREINATYVHRFSELVEGDAELPKRNIKDEFTVVAHGVLYGVENSVVKSLIMRDASGKYINCVLVWFPDSAIRKMRKLSM